MFKEVDVLLGDGGESDPERQRPGTMRELSSPYLKMVRCLFLAYFLFSERIVKIAHFTISCLRKIDQPDVI